MMGREHKSLAAFYRPTRWEDVCDQQSVIKILTRQLETQQILNAYMFIGASGCGKTTLARILANAINNGVGNPIEVDAASNNGVDNVKAIIKSAQERAIDGKYKIYIIDECHMITTQGWNAFLKCIEEPPAYTIFIFCTTDPQKVPATIMNRVQRFNITRITVDNIKNRLSYICEQEGFTNYEESVDYLAKLSNGGMRDAISYLEKCAGYSSDLCINNVLNALGNYSYDLMFDLANSLIDGDESKVFHIINSLYQQGNDLKLFVDMFLSFIMDVAKYAVFKNCDMIKIPSSMQEKLNHSINFNDALKYYMYIANKLLDLKVALKNESDIKTTVEIYMINIARLQ